MFQRFLEIETRPTTVPPEMTRRYLDVMLNHFRVILPTLMQSARDAGWNAMPSSWLQQEYHIYEGFGSPTFKNGTGNLVGVTYIGEHLRNKGTYLVKYTIVDQKDHKATTIESKGYRISPEGLHIVDYVRDPNVQITVYRDNDDAKIFEFLERLLTETQQLTQSPAPGKE